MHHIIRIIGLSLFATITLFPISAVDAYYISTFNSYFWLITVAIIILSDTFSAFIAHLFAERLTRLVIRSDKNKLKLEKVSDRLQSKGRWGMVAFAATPLPYSLAIYTYAAAQVPFTKILIPLVIGRIIKYFVITASLLFGWGLFT